ncbi:MAG TPA: hypothetical protein VI670_12170 [Thermoanaerobaculia bacterium]
MIEHAPRDTGPCADQTEERIEVGHTILRKLVRVPFQLLEACGVEAIPQCRINRSAQTHEHHLTAMKGTEHGTRNKHQLDSEVGGNRNPNQRRLTLRMGNVQTLRCNGGPGAVDQSRRLQ